MRNSDREGYLMIDHRQAGANQPAEVMMKAGLPAHAGRGLFEAATLTCHCCQRTWAKNPLRTRPRHYCRKHDAYHCDDCAARVHLSGICIPWKQVREEAYEAGLKGIAYKAPWTP